MFKVPSQELLATLKTTFWKIPYSWIIYGHGLTLSAKYFIKTLVNIMKQKSMKVPGKDKLHKNPSVHFEEPK